MMNLVVVIGDGMVVVLWVGVVICDFEFV